MNHIKRNVVVQTKQGEMNLNISLDLNINITNSGGINIGVENVSSENKKEEDKLNYIIPDFSGCEKIKFGKEV